jgi:hypothetical protein
MYGILLQMSRSVDTSGNITVMLRGTDSVLVLTSVLTSTATNNNYLSLMNLDTNPYII